MEPKLDLTLKLGLPVSDRTVETTLSLQTPTSINTHQGFNIGSVRPDNDGGSGGGGGDRKMFGNRQRFLGVGRAISENAGNNVSVNIMFSNYVLQRFSGAANTSGHLTSPMDPAPAPSVTLSECVMIDVPARRAQRNSSVTNALHLNANANAQHLNANRNASFSGKRRGCGGGWYRYNERFKRCTNIKCNTDETPMWRKGPLGPKSLCNACGIKYRKETERRARNNN